MKAEYKKPFAHIEHFTLSQTIASGCGATPGGDTLGKPNHWDKTTCGWEMGNLVVWTDDNEGCTFKWGADDPMDGVCYNNPSDGGIFSS